MLDIRELWSEAIRLQCSGTAEKSPEAPQKSAWNKAEVRHGSIRFFCPSCRKPLKLPLALLDPREPQAPADAERKGLELTMETILWGKSAPGNIVAFTIAFVIGVGAMWALESTMPGILAGGVFYAIRRPFIRAFMKRLPVWHYDCDSCGHKVEVACNGKEVAVGS